MNHHFTQPHSDGVSAEASASEAVVATVVLALLLQVLWRCCCHVKKYFSSSFSATASMDPAEIAEVEKILKYKFKNKRLVEEALTHTSCKEKVSFQRLEFIGDAALGLAVATHFLGLGQLKLTAGQLTKLREYCVNNKKLARIAAQHRLYWFVRRHNTDSLDDYVREYEEAVEDGDDDNITVTHPRIPRILADIVESLAGAVYLDVNFDLTKLWRIFKDVLMVDKIMLPKDETAMSSEINGAQDKLYGLCGKRKWKKPVYSPVKDEGLSHEKKFVYSVTIEIEDDVLCMEGDERSSVTDAKNSAAYSLIHSLQES